MDTKKQNKINFLHRNNYSDNVINFAVQENIRYDKNYKSLPWVCREVSKQNIDIEKINYVLDWFNSNPGINIMDLSFDEAYAKSDKWHKTIGEDKLEILRLTKIPVNMEKVVAHIDGYYIVKLDTPEELNREGKLMKNCVSERFLENHNYGKVWFLYSLRNKENIPFVTLTLENQDNKIEIREIKGRANTFPKLEYQVIILKWIKELRPKSLKIDIDFTDKNSDKLIEFLIGLDFIEYLSLRLRNIKKMSYDIFKFKNLRELDLSFNELEELPS